MHASALSKLTRVADMSFLHPKRSRFRLSPSVPPATL